ncbi:MAG: collagen-like protein [Phycisphaerae bacterium]|jgi:hypothetical protein
MIASLAAPVCLSGGCPAATSTDGTSQDIQELIDAAIDQAGLNQVPTPGPAGPQGDPGPQGEQGEQGEPGDPGQDGLDGQNGADGLDGQDGQDGQDGDQGPAGAEGALSVYGDGSDGSHTISADASLEAWAVANGVVSYQFEDLTIDSGVTLEVPSGFSLYCRGTFTNNGTIVVQTAAAGSSTERPAQQGISKSKPFVGAAGLLPDLLPELGGGGGGAGLPDSAMTWLLRPGPVGGGGGARQPPGGQGGAGGGTFLVLALEGIVNNGEIHADGAAGDGGGGGGGVISLAARGSIALSAGSVLSARGADGAPASDDPNAPAVSSGGGGGGIVRIFAPEVSSLGAIHVEGGAGGDGTQVFGVVGGTLCYSAGGGGGSYGAGGGSGTAVYAAEEGEDETWSIDLSAGESGAVGWSLITEADPTVYLYR